MGFNYSRVFFYSRYIMITIHRQTAPWFAQHQPNQNHENDNDNNKATPNAMPTIPPPKPSFFSSLLFLIEPLYLRFDPLRSIPPITPAAIATPLTIATPIIPSLATLSSISPLRLSACRFEGSWSRSRSLNFRASA